MSRVDFYFIPQSGSQARLLFACRLLEKAYQQEQPVYVHLENAEKAHFFDQLLWTYRDDSFLPHQLISDEKMVFSSPLQLGYSEQPQTPASILLNLHTEIPAFHHHFQRILEIMSNEAQFKIQAEKFRIFYQEKGYTIHSHQIQALPFNGK